MTKSVKNNFWDTESEVHFLRRKSFLYEMAQRSVLDIKEYIFKYCGINISIEIHNKNELDDILLLYDIYLLKCKKSKSIFRKNFVGRDIIAACLLKALMDKSENNIFIFDKIGKDSRFEFMHELAWVSYIMRVTSSVIGVKMKNIPEIVYAQLSHIIMKNEPIAIEWSVLLMRALTDAYGDASADESD